QVEVVHHGDHPAAARAIVPGELHDGQLVADVEAGDGLVEHQEAGHAVEDRVPDLRQHAGKLDALLLSAGKLLVEAALETLQVDGGKRLGGDRLRMGRVVVQPGRQPHAHDLANG